PMNGSWLFLASLLLLVDGARAVGQEARSKDDKVSSARPLRLAGGKAIVAGRLRPDAPRFENKASQTYDVDLQAGSMYQFDLLSTSFDAYLYVLDPSGKVLKQDDNGGGNRNARLMLMAGKTGVHRVVASAVGNAGAGTFNLAVVETQATLPLVMDNGR